MNEAEYVSKASLIKTMEDCPFTMSMGCLSIDECNGMNRARKIFTEIFKSLPAADVVEVVRCRDCTHRDPADKKCDCGGLERAGCIFSVDDDYFCAFGERMDGGAGNAAD